MPDNVTSMMYNVQNGPPWHGKGKPVNGLATAAECIRGAGLDWGVAKVPIRVDDIGALAVPGVMVTVRTDLSPDDPRRILGVVGEEYQPLQNWEAFGFFDRYVSTGAIYETAGAIDNGRRIWLLARLPHTISPVPHDEVVPYLLLANGHDGSLMVHIKYTPVRVVCQNTLALALMGTERRVALRHDRGLRRRLDTAAEVLRLIGPTVERAEVTWKRMAMHRLAEKDAERYFRSVFGGVDDEHEEAVPSEQRPVIAARQQSLLGDANHDAEVAIRPRRQVTGLKQKAAQNYHSEMNHRLRIQDTLWAAYNAATWAVDWSRQTQHDRVDDLCFGDGARIKQRAYDKAVALLEQP